MWWVDSYCITRRAASHGHVKAGFRKNYQRSENSSGGPESPGTWKDALQVTNFFVTFLLPAHLSWRKSLWRRGSHPPVGRLSFSGTALERGFTEVRGTSHSPYPQEVPLYDRPIQSEAAKKRRR